MMHMVGNVRREIREFLAVFDIPALADMEKLQFFILFMFAGLIFEF